MKKLVPFIVFIIATIVIIGQTPNYTKKQDQQKEVYKSKKKSIKEDAVNKGHAKYSINCKTCHNCEYPTKADPCLADCMRKNMISVYHSPSEGPEVVVLSQLSNNFTSVVFSHKLHAQMSEMSDGCSGCHHYNTTGPILNCKKCHEVNRSRDDISKPDLKGAYHRQCMECHRQWSRSTSCTEGCHLQKSPDKEAQQMVYLNSLIGRDHPEIPKPGKVVYETMHEKGKIVTFFHNEHTELFNIKCISCHQHENCLKCHDKSHKTPPTELVNTPKKIHKSFEDHHNPCSSCHKTDNCNKCHSNKEQMAFNHSVSTKFPLKSYHSRLNCEKCHSNNKYGNLDRTCSNCHKNFVQGKFDHAKAGLILSDSHKELECQSCHIKNNFSRISSCAECHDDKSPNKDIPGKRIDKNKKAKKK